MKFAHVNIMRYLIVSSGVPTEKYGVQYPAAPSLVVFGEKSFERIVTSRSGLASNSL